MLQICDVYAGTTTVVLLVVIVVAMVALAVTIFVIVYCKFRRSVLFNYQSSNCLQVTLYYRPLACLVPSQSPNKTMSFHNEIEKQETNSYYDMPEDLILNVSYNVYVCVCVLT